jgi:hypothetical protein
MGFWQTGQEIEDVLGQVLEVGFGLGRDALAGVEVEPAVFPGVEELDAL